LAGGTNFALQYNRLISNDIDLFCSEIIGINSFQKIQDQLKEYFEKVLETLIIKSP
jgi:hypothetical protein